MSQRDAIFITTPTVWHWEISPRALTNPCGRHYRTRLLEIPFRSLAAFSEWEKEKNDFLEFNQQFRSTRTFSILRRVTAMTVRRTVFPSCSKTTDSPSSGICPNVEKMNPATVS